MDKNKKEDLANLKAGVEGYNPNAFFFKQEYSEGTRFVAWTPTLSQLKALVYDILKIFASDLEILLKVRIRGKDDEAWNRYYGEIEHSKLTDVLKNNELYVFQDGEHQLCVRDTGSGEYIALDDHDTLFIYSDFEQVMAICKKNGFENREEKLISETGHWHCELKDSAVLCQKLINALSLEPVE
jgi:hypothetical protein